MKKIILLLFLSLLISSCAKCYHIYVNSIITNKYDREWVQIIYANNVAISIPHHDYYFQFNEWKPYTKKVNESDYEKFEISDMYTFAIEPREKSYFFSDSIVVVEE